MIFRFLGLSGALSFCSSSRVARSNGIACMRPVSLILDMTACVRAIFVVGVSLDKGVMPLCEAMLYSMCLYDCFDRYLFVAYVQVWDSI